MCRFCTSSSEKCAYLIQLSTSCSHIFSSYPQVIHNTYAILLKMFARFHRTFVRKLHFFTHFFALKLHFFKIIFCKSLSTTFKAKILSPDNFPFVAFLLAIFIIFNTRRLVTLCHKQKIKPLPFRKTWNFVLKRAWNRGMYPHRIAILSE